MTINLVGQSARWSIRYYIDIVQHAPLVTVPGEERRVDPISLYLTFVWDERYGAWSLGFVDLTGTEVLADEEYGDHIEVEFYDPNRGETEYNGGFPVWVWEIADKIAPKLPVPQEIKINE